MAWDRPVDDFDIDAFQVFDGSALVQNVPGFGFTATKIRHLVPGTSHSFTVRTLRVRDEDGCGVWRFTWTQSTDNTDPQSAIEYEIFVNSEPSDSPSRSKSRGQCGLGRTPP